MTVNSDGDTVSRRAELELYDSLPPEVRRALQDAPIQFGASTARRFAYRGYNTYEDLMHIFRDYMTGGDDYATRRAWTYTIRKPGLLYAGLHDGKDHPQASRDYPWSEYQMHGRKRTRVVNIGKEDNDK